MNKTTIFALLLFFWSTHLGCMNIPGRIKPTFVDVTTIEMVPVLSTAPIALINTQRSPNRRVDVWDSSETGVGSINDNARKTLEAGTDVADWTEQVITITKGWLTRYRVQVSAGSHKTLGFHISNVSIRPSGLKLCTRLTLTVETQTGIRRELPVEICAFDVDRSVGWTLHAAVLALMNDETILRYIGEE